MQARSSSHDIAGCDLIQSWLGKTLVPALSSSEGHNKPAAWLVCMLLLRKACPQQVHAQAQRKGRMGVTGWLTVNAQYPFLLWSGMPGDIDGVDGPCS